jgi:TP901 family phage tail tape measure protein
METFRIEIPIEVQDKTDPGVSQATKKISQFDKTIEKTKSKMDEFNKTKFSAVIEAVDKASAVAGRIGTSLKGITGKVWSVTMTVLDKATAPIRGVINLLKNPLIQLGAVIGVSVGLKDTIDTFASFEATMSKVQAVGEMTADQIALVTEKAKEMGRTTKFTATEAGEAFTFMAQAGWSTEQMLAGIDGVLALSAADGLDLASTASIVTDTLAAFGLKAEDTSRFADVLAKAAAATNVDVAQMGETFKYVAPIAGAMGYSVDDMATAIGLMANASVKGSMAGTALKTAISNLVTPTDEQAKLMKELGVSMTDSNGNAQSFHTVMSDLRTGFSKLSATEKTAAASTLFGSYAMSGMLAIMNAAQEDFDSLSESIANSEGTAERMAEIMLDNVAGSFTLLQSAVEGVKISLGERLAPYLRQFASWLTGKMPAIEKAIGGVMDYIDGKVTWLRETIQEFTSGEDWENADVWGKIKIAWDKIIAEPFSSWWNSTGKQFFADKATSIGKGIGSGITMGLLALLGINVSDTIGEGKSVGAGFLKGFKEGFDTKQITQAFKDWANNNKEVVAALGVILGGKLIGGVYRGVKEAKSLITDIKNIFTKGSGNTLPGASPSAYTTTTMTVTSNVVNVYGKSVNNIGQAAKDIIKTAGGAAGGAALGAGGAKALLTGGAAALPAAGAPLLLPGAAGGAATAATAGGLTSATGALGTLLQAGSTSSVIAADGTLVAVTGGVGGTLGSVGGALGTTATTAAGAAAAGVAGGAGIIGGLLGLGSAAIDLFKGIGKSKEGDTKGAKDQYVTAGTKTGMVAAGAGTGALIGSVVPGVGTAIGALVGAGVGGVGALLGGNKAGKALSDATDKDGGLTKLWESIKTGASNAGTWVADKWGETGDWISDKWSGFSDWFDTSVWTPVKDVGISAINIAAGAWSEGKDWVSEKWSDFSAWFDESVWTPVSEAAQAAGEWVGEKWDDTKTWISDRWTDFSTWFGETVWTPVSNAAQVAGQWVSDRWNEARTWVGDRWSDFSGWFEESIWAPVKTGAQAAGEWVSEKWDGAKTWVGETWGTVSDWFSETVWEPVKGAAETAGEWLGTQFDAAWTAVSNAWDGVSGWFEDNVWGPIKSGATTAWNWVGEKLGGIGEWIGDKWTSFKGWLGGLGQKGSKETGLTTSQGKGSILEHAHGGIMTKPHMGIVAEAGAESIIPLSPSKRTRGIDLWRETGELLGVRPYADGGVVGKIKIDDEDMPVATGNNSGGVTIKIDVAANPEFTIGTGSAGDDEQILTVLKAHIRSMADDIGDELAERLARIFVNMPVKA